MTLYGIEKEMLSSKELHCWHHKKKKTGLCGWAGISAIGLVWLMHSADVHSTLEGREEVQTARLKCLNFLILKYEFLFHHQ